jgi:cbb3-type cytochrome oxidase subunit 1
MPAISVWLLRLSLVALLAGAALGSWLLGAEPWPSAWLSRLRAAHVYLMLFGWLLPFVLGTAFWILPRHAHGAGRGSPGLGVAGTILLSLGVAIGLTGSLAGAQVVWRGGLACTVLGALTFLRLLWRRVKAFGGER